MRILVTGGAGFIGSHIVEAYYAAGHDVAILDDLSSGSMDNLAHLEEAFDGPRLHMYHGSITDPRIVRWVFDSFKPEIVNHQAAIIDMSLCEENEALATYTNIEGTKNLLRYSAECGSVKLFIFASSAGAIYGETPEPMSADNRMSEGFEPKSVYGKTKVFAEVCVVKHCHEFRCVILRYSNVYGPRARAGVIPAFVRALREGEDVTIYGDGEQVRDFVHVSDVAQASVKALDSKAVLSIVDISEGSSRSINDVYRQFRLSRDSEDGFEAIYAPSRGFEIVESRVSPHLAKDLLCWVPQTSFSDGIRELLNGEEGSKGKGDPRMTDVCVKISAPGIDELIEKLEKVRALLKEIGEADPIAIKVEAVEPVVVEELEEELAEAEDVATVMITDAGEVEPEEVPEIVEPEPVAEVVEPEPEVKEVIAPTPEVGE